MNFSNAIKFLEELSLNNNREWFNLNKERYSIIKEEFDQFIENLIPKIRQIDPGIGPVTAKDCVFRIYRDVRFSANKDPYKTHLGAHISSGGRKTTFAGYYFHLQPGQTFVASGAYQPSPEALKEIRYEMYDNIEEFLKIVSGKDFKKYFGEIAGEKGKLAPKGFPKDFPQIELIKHKSFEIWHQIKNEQLFDGKIENTILDAVKIAVPFNKFLNKAIQNSLSQE